MNIKPKPASIKIKFSTFFLTVSAKTVPKKEFIFFSFHSNHEKLFRVFETLNSSALPEGS